MLATNPLSMASKHPPGEAMTIRLYGSWFSTFARKVAVALELKGLAYEHVDALTREYHSELLQINPRAEVPVLTDEELSIVNSSDILQYLDWRYPERPLYPAAIPDRVAARALERLADERLDPIVVDCSFWHWADRDDKPPAGLLDAGQRDLDAIFARLEQVIATRSKPWPFGAPGLVECAWFPNLVAVRPLGFALDAARYPTLRNWLRAMRSHPVFAADATRTAAFLKTLKDGSSHERRRLFWSGARVEWLLSRGFHAWLMTEIEAGRAVFPA
jgi:glutathione S-transferase